MGVFPQALICILLIAAHADSDNFPIKSTNLNKADTISFYNLPEMNAAMQSGVADMHAVHGIETSAGDFIWVGKGLESEASAVMESFAVKMSKTGSFVWGWTSKSAGNDVANSVVQLGAGGDLLIAGYKTEGGVAKKYLTKLSLSTGVAAWTGTDFGDSAGSHGAWETIDITTAKDGVLVGGAKGLTSTDEMTFKSYGNVIGGKAVAMHFSLAAVNGGSPPTSNAATWTANFDDSFTAKAVRPMKDGGCVVLLYKEGASKMATLARLSSGGQTTWGPTEYGTKHGEGTDVVVVEDGSGFAITGHGAGGNTDGYLYGRLTKVNNDGVWQWSKSYGSCLGTDGAWKCGTKFIKNECWGLQSLSDGFVIGCGTGIENCDGMSGQMATDCAAGKALTGDTRADAVKRKASVWQSLVIRTDAEGKLLWQRVDQYRAAGQAALGSAGWEEQSSASEFVMKTADGSLAFVQDEVSGIGIMKLKAQSATSAATTGSGTTGSATMSTAGSATTGSATTGSATTSTIGSATVGASHASTIQFLVLGIVASLLLQRWWI